MILGTSAYKNGARATTFRPKVDAGLGYLKGEENTARVARTYYLNGHDTERVARRARTLREAAGTLSAVAVGDDDATPGRDVLADVLEAFGAESSLQWPVLADRFPERWQDTTGDAVSAECRPLGEPSVNVNADGTVLKGCRARDVEKAAGR
jgi:DNA segregation ATPase FtsK/SpoIIIE, S-DNA-T family